MNAAPLIVVGIGHDGPKGLLPATLRHVDAAAILAGGRRQLDFFPNWRGEKIALGSDVTAFIDALRQRYRQERTVVLASGDPLFYGIGRALLEVIPKEDLLFLPHLGSVQLAFARVKETWHDARVVSLHGRPTGEFVAAVDARVPKIAVLTDGTNHPAAIAGLLRQCGAGQDYTMWVCENLGGEDERISCHGPGTMSEETFAALNVVILLRQATPGAERADCTMPIIGLPETMLQHQPGPRGMITRREVRLLAICYLELRPAEVLWDVGAGSGSVSLEAARLAPSLQVFAIERDAGSINPVGGKYQTSGHLKRSQRRRGSTRGIGGLAGARRSFHRRQRRKTCAYT